MCKNYKYIRELSNAKTAANCRKVVQKGGSRETIALAEIAKNVLAKRILLSPKQKRKLCCKKRFIRRLASRLTSAPQKKQLIQRGGFAVAASILASAAIPYIIEAIRNRGNNR